MSHHFGPYPIYSPKNLRSRASSHQRRITELETNANTFIPPVPLPPPTQSFTYQFQGTQFAKMNGVGDARIYPTSAPSSIDEETLATVVAYATFDDIGGNGTGTVLTSGGIVSESFTSASFTGLSFGAAFLEPEFKIPLLDGEGRTAWYRGYFPYLNWSPFLAPEVEHTKQFMAGHCLELNVPGTVSNDQKSFAYYDSHANFNVSSSISVSLWVYPTDLTSLGGTGARYLCYRYIDASNYWILFIDTANSNQVKIFVNEAAATTKIRTSIDNPLTLDAWNNVIFTYNPSTNALVLYVNNTAHSTSAVTVQSPPYTTDANMYLGGLPGITSNRFTGYMDNFVFWSGKILSAGEVTNMWTRGTII